MDKRIRLGRSVAYHGMRSVARHQLAGCVVLCADSWIRRAAACKVPNL